VCREAVDVMVYGRHQILSKPAASKPATSKLATSQMGGMSNTTQMIKLAT